MEIYNDADIEWRNAENFSNSIPEPEETKKMHPLEELNLDGYWYAEAEHRDHRDDIKSDIEKRNGVWFLAGTRHRIGKPGSKELFRFKA